MKLYKFHWWNFVGLKLIFYQIVEKLKRYPQERQIKGKPEPPPSS